ncbi:zinc finger, CCHC-type containing protein [Tanacetum coccineum]
MAAAMKHIASNFAKLNKFEGVDFIRWQKKMHFLCSSMSVVYVLTTPISDDAGDATMEQLRNRAKWDNDDYVCRGLILKDLRFSSGKIVSLFNVLHVPNIRKNLVSAFMSTSKLNDSILCLLTGHVHFKRMQDMSKDGLIPAFDMDTEKFCYVYLLHTKDEALDKFKVFKTEVELQPRSLIKRFRTDRGGEYMDTLYFQSVGISLLDWVRAVVRLPDPKLKALGERGIECIFVGLLSIPRLLGKLSMYTSNPGTQHWQGIQWVLKYLKKTMDYRLIYTGYPLVLEGYTDASWISNTEDNSSLTNTPIALMLRMTPRHLMAMNTIKLLLAMASIHNLIIYQMDVKIAFLNVELDEEVDIIKEFLSSRFSMKDMRKADVIPEFMALAAAGKEAEWLKNLLIEITLWFKPIAPISIRCDSDATLAKSYSQMYNGKSRHFSVRHNMICELITNRVESIEFVIS